MPDEVDKQSLPQRSVLPPWAISIAAHAALVLVMGWMLKVTPRGVATEPARSVGIVLKRVQADEVLFEGEDDLEKNAEPQTVESEAVDALLSEADVPDVSDSLPEVEALLGPAALEGSGVGGAGEMTEGAAQPKSVKGGAAQVSVYGLSGEGHRFVYVFDRSESMTGAPLASAKQQLLASLESLERQHQMQIVFFNHHRRVFDLAGGRRQMPFATDVTKRMARRFVSGITAGGGTDRYAALVAAINMGPDVVFFLTDVDNPMSAAEVDRITRANRGTSINTIQFGYGPGPGGDNFLKQLARRNAGEHVYVDISRLRRGR